MPFQQMSRKITSATASPPRSDPIISSDKKIAMTEIGSHIAKQMSKRRWYVRNGRQKSCEASMAGCIPSSSDEQLAGRRRVPLIVTPTAVQTRRSL